MTSDLHELLAQAKALVENEGDLIANMANLSSLLFQNLTDVNWIGFYLLRGNELVVGPFQGLPACTRIPLGQGVCGTAAQKCNTLVVPDVHDFAGHIACDVASRSEIVVPIVVSNDAKGVLDVDSPIVNRFDDSDRLFFEGVVSLLISSVTNWDESGLGIAPA